MLVAVVAGAVAFGDWQPLRVKAVNSTTQARFMLKIVACETKAVLTFW